MKQLLLLAAIITSSFAVKAQDAINTAHTCDVEYRQVCISPAPNCNKTYPNGTAWISLPAFASHSLTLSTCNPTDVIGFEVRYIDTDCGDLIVTVSDNRVGPMGCPDVTMHAYLPYCSKCCEFNRDINVYFDGNVLMIND